MSKSIEVKKGPKGFGLAFRDKVDGEEDDHNGVFVDYVTPQGPADLSQIKKNDNILKINGQQPKDLNDAKNLVGLSADMLKLDIFHCPVMKMESENGVKMTVSSNSGAVWEKYHKTRSHSKHFVKVTSLVKTR